MKRGFGAASSASSCWPFSARSLPRLWYLQVAATDQFHAAAVSNSVRKIVDPPFRGRILDAQNRVLVDNKVENQITIESYLEHEGTASGPGAAVEAAQDVGQDAEGQPLRSAELAIHRVPIVADGVDESALIYIAEHRSEFPGVRRRGGPGPASTPMVRRRSTSWATSVRSTGPS